MVPALSLAIVLALAEGTLVVENDYVKVTRRAAPCAAAATRACGDRIIVALGPIEVSASGNARRMARGDIAVFPAGQSYQVPASSDFLEVVLKPEHPPVQGPAVRLAPEKNR